MTLTASGFVRRTRTVALGKIYDVTEATSPRSYDAISRTAYDINLAANKSSAQRASPAGVALHRFTQRTPNSLIDASSSCRRADPGMESGERFDLPWPSSQPSSVLTAKSLANVVEFTPKPSTKQD